MYNAVAAVPGLLHTIQMGMIFLRAGAIGEGGGDCVRTPCVTWE